MDMPKQQVGFYVWQPRQNHCLDFLRQIGAMPSGYGTTTWHFDFATSSFSIKLFFSISFYMFYCFMEMFCVFLFSRRIVLIWEWLFWFGRYCSDSGGIVLIREVFFWTAAQTRAKPRYPYGKKRCREGFVAEGKGGAMKTGGIGNIFPRGGRILKGRNKIR